MDDYSDPDLEAGFNEPMPWIGVYIALASLTCALAMLADLSHGFLKQKIGLPCKYFTMNAVYLSLMAIAMKLPVDLNNPMIGVQDQAAKLGSLAFMCTMMANCLPSLATMDGKELLSNILALGVLVITIIVNVGIQIETGNISYAKPRDLSYAYGSDYLGSGFDSNVIAAVIYVAMLFMLLMIHICVSLAILKSKQILESKYQARHQETLRIQQPSILTVEYLKQHVSKYYIMAETGSPQFMIACSAASSAAGVICKLSTLIYLLILFWIFRNRREKRHSDYKWSIVGILITQLLGIMLGSFAPICRCYASMSFKWSIKRFWNHFKLFKLESYWTPTLSDWKHSISFPFLSRKRKIAIQKLKFRFLRYRIVFQKAVVATCKIIALIPIFFMICAIPCVNRLRSMYCTSGISPAQSIDLNLYVLPVEEGLELNEVALQNILKSVNRLIEKAQKQQPKNLTQLLQGSEGVGKFDINRVKLLLEEVSIDCWSLPLITLTTIAISLPNIQKNIVESLLSSVSEGLVYVTHVEESPDSKRDYVSIHKVTKKLWQEVELYHKWIGKKLKEHVPQANTAEPILQWFTDTSQAIVDEVVHSGLNNDDSTYRRTSADSMKRITERMMLSCDPNMVSEEELFKQLSSMISNIFVSCLTKLPQVIVTKCHTNVIKKREASIHAAAQLLGETMQIINVLQGHGVQPVDLDGSSFFSKCRAYIRSSRIWVKLFSGATPSS